jgi:hypothetical protein
MHTLQKLSLYIAVMTFVVATFLPYRFVASHANVLQGASNNFYYWPAMFLWPSWSFIVTFSVHVTGRLLRLPWDARVIALLVILAAWFYVPLLDKSLGLEDGGNVGLRYWPGHSQCCTTPMLSVLMCPLALIAGVAAGEIVGWWCIAKLRAERLI